MKNAMILFGLWIGIILMAYGLVYLDDAGPTPAQLALLERIAARTYIDAADRFQFETPPGWRVREIEDGVALVGPIERIDAWVLAVAGSTEEAIAYACLLAHPCPGAEVLSQREFEAPAGVRRKTRTTFAADDPDLSMYAVALETTGGTVVLFVRCRAESCDRRATELLRLEESLAVRDLKRLPAMPSVVVPSSTTVQTDSACCGHPDDAGDLAEPGMPLEEIEAEPVVQSVPATP